MTTKSKLSTNPRHKLNAICPYYTMFPLELPVRILQKFGKDTVVLDPFCGRGTTNYAARIKGLKTYGIDNSCVAVAIAKAKLSDSTVSNIMKLMEEILETKDSYEIPKEEYWEWAFHPSTLEQICKLRSGLLRIPNNDTSIILRALVLGCLHGPKQKDILNPSYFSNQLPRTFSSKPQYSIRYWKEKNLYPSKVDIRIPLNKKAKIIFCQKSFSVSTPINIFHGDCREYSSFKHIKERVGLVITSPPYYGMKTYEQDQWLRNWFLGGPSTVDYKCSQQFAHSSPTDFAKSLARVWDNVYNVADDNMKMIVRFGALGSKAIDHQAILMASLEESAGFWKVYLRRKVGSSEMGRRQAQIMGSRVKSPAIEEQDYFIRLQ